MEGVRVALISPEGWGLGPVRDQLARAGIFPSREFHKLEEISQALRADEFDLLVIRIETFSRPMLNAIERLRSLEKNCGILTVVSSIEPAVRFEARNLPRHIVLELPKENKDIVASVEALASRSRSRARLHPRVQRAEELTISTAEKSVKVSGYFVDFAQMGAKLVLDGKSDFKENQSVIVEYRSSSDRTRVHKIHSKIAWVKECRSEHTLMGVRFIASA
jgi:hypothetical protein